MPVERRAISVSQLSELLGVEPGRFKGIEPDRGGRGGIVRDSSRWWIVLEPETDMQTTGTNPPLHDNTQRRPPKKGKGKRGC